jgi:hypothetical protein
VEKVADKPVQLPFTGTFVFISDFVVTLSAGIGSAVPAEEKKLK